MSNQTSFNDREVVDELPITTSSPSDASVVRASANKLTLVPLIFLIYFEVSGGPYGQEPTVQAAGPLLAILGFAIFPFLWCVPEALITAELATAFPGNGGFVLWAKCAFGTFPGSMLGYLKFLGAVINIATFPVLSIEYMDKLFPVFDSGWPRVLAIAVSMCILSFLNFTGLKIVGYGSIIFGIVVLMPFALMSLIAIPKIEPHRWGRPVQKGMQINWNLYLNTLFWNLNFWDSVSTLAGEVDKPQKTFPAALLFAVIFTWVSYLIPLLAVTGALPFNQNQWGSGFHAVAADIIAGKWLKIWLEAGAVLSSIGMFEAQLSSTTYQLLGMADLGLLPKFFSVRHSKFGTPWVGILVSSSIALAMSFIDFKDMISSANFLYSLGMLLEFASFIWLRKKLPSLNRPYRVPLEIPGLVIMCLLPSCVLLMTMRYATWVVCLISGLMIAGAVGSFFLMEILKSNKIFKFSTAVEIQEGFSRLSFCG